MPFGLGLFRMVLRRILADWPVLAASAITLLLAGILVSAAPIYARAVSDAGLQRSLNDTPITEAGIQVSGRFNLQTYPEGEAFVREQTANIAQTASADRVRIGRSDSFAFPGQETVRDLTVFGFYDRLEDHVSFVAGREPDSNGPPYEVAISQDTAEIRSLSVGDEFQLIYRHDASYAVDVVIAGIFQIENPSDNYWYESELEVSGFVEGQSFDTYGPMVVTPTVFFEVATPRQAWVRWRFFPDFDTFTTSNAPTIRQLTTRLSRNVHNEEVAGARFVVESQLPQLIRTLERSLLVTQASVTIVIVQLAILAGYALVLTSRLIVDHRRVETAVLRARGASSLQLFGLALIEAIVLAIPLMLIAPWIATAVLQLFNRFGPLAEIELVIEPSITSGAFLGVAIAGIIGVLLLSLPVLREREATPGAQAGKHRQEAAGLWQRAGIDIAILIVAAIGFVQLRRFSSPITETVQGRLGIDPLLVAAPALGLVAGAILALRIVPLLATIGDRVAAKQRAALLALSAWQIARRPLVYSRAMLLLLLAIGIGIFTISHTETWQQSQVDQANYAVGADIRLEPDQRFSRQLDSINVSDAHAQIDGVNVSMPVVERLEQFGTPARSGSILLMDTVHGIDALRMRDDIRPEGFNELITEMAEARSSVDAIPLNGQPVRISVDASLVTEETELDPEQQFVRIWITLLDGQGYLHRIELGRLNRELTDNTLIIDLSRPLDENQLARPIYPLGLAAIEIGTIGTPDTDNLGRITLENWQISETVDSDDWIPAMAAGMDQLDWQTSWHAFSSQVWAELDVDANSDDLVIDYVAGSEPQAQVRTVTLRIAPPVPELPNAAPVLISEPLRELGDFSIGDTILVPIGAFAFDGRVAGIIEGFPGTRAHDRPTVIADLPTIVAIYERPGIGPFGPDERWLSVDVSAHDQIVGTLEASPYSSRRLVSSDDRADELQRDPVALGTLGALAMGFVAATIVAGAGVIASSAGSARQRMGEFLLMRAIGLSPRQLTGWLFIENSLLIVLGVIGGTALGIMLGWLILPLIALTQQAQQVYPGVNVIIPWTTILFVQAAGLILLGVLTAILGLIVRRGGLGEALRVRDD